MSYQLLDAQAKHAELGPMFDIPSNFMLDTLAPGSKVKLCAEFKPTPGVVINGERFWLLVTEYDKETGKGKGVVHSIMEYFDQHGIVEDDTIEFERKHVVGMR